MKDSFGGFYKDKVVLVTGHTGFKGSWLCTWLVELGATVVGYALDPPSDPCNFDSSALANKILDIRGDIRDATGVSDVLAEHEPDVVFHLAAQALVRTSYQEPVDTFSTNVMGSVNVMEAVRKTPSVKAIINVTSDKCYANREQVWGYKENDPMGGDDPYSASKGAAELVFRAYQHSYFSHIPTLGAASVRAGNVIGGGDWGRDRIVPDSLRAFEKNEPISVRNPRAIRPWQHVLEPLSGYLWLASLLASASERYSGGWNFGPKETAAKTVAELATKIVELWGEGKWNDVSDKNDKRLHEAHWLKLSVDKAQSELPWSAVLNFDETMELTMNWYRHHHEYRATNMYQFGVHQIRDYTRLAGERGQQWTRA